MKTNSVPGRLTGKYAIIQSFLWTGYVAVIAFSSVYLLGEGFSNAEIGMVTAIASIASVVLQPALATFADRPKSPSLKRILSYVGASMLLLAFLLLIPGKPGMLTGLLFGGVMALLLVLTPLVNSLGVDTINQGGKLDFGVARGIGSFAYAVVAFLLGQVTGKMGSGTVPVFIVLVLAGFLAALWFFPYEKKEDGKGGGAARDSGFFYFVKRYKRFSVALFGCIFTYTSHVLVSNYIFQIVESKGGGNQEMGIVTALCAFVELPTMFLFGYFLKVAGGAFWFRLSGVFFMLKALGTLLAPNMAGLYFVQMFQILGWALICVASVYYVNSIMAPEDVIKGQAYMTMTHSIGSVIGSMLGGLLIDFFGVPAMLACASAMAFCGMVIIMATVREKKIGERV